MKPSRDQYREIVLYSVFGILTFFIDTGLFLLCSFLLDLENHLWLMHICNIGATLIAITFAYITNRRYVFESKNQSLIKEMIEFYGARVFTLVLSEILLQITVGEWELSVQWMKIVINVIVIVLNYIFSKFWIFKNTGRIGEKRK